jgi:hypothetical protein
MSKDLLLETIQASIEKGLSPKDSLSSLLAYLQYHNKFKNIFEFYKNKFNEKNLIQKRNICLEKILMLTEYKN